MAYVPESLKEVAKQVQRGEKPTATVRTLLSWFWGSQRRGAFIVSAIRRALAEVSLKTEPDFDLTYLDGRIAFLPLPKEKAVVEEPPSTQESSFTADAVLVKEQARTSIDPAYRVGSLALANNPPVSVLPSDTVRRATTIMLRENYSQLPVIDEGGHLHGIFSWKSLGSRQALGQSCEHVRDATDIAYQVTTEMPLLRVMKLIEEHDCVFLMNDQKKVMSIITHYDISGTFAELSEPFLVLREIEIHLRGFITDKFSDDEVICALDLKKPPRQSGVVNSLTFWQYIKLMDDPGRWAKLDIRIDLEMFRHEVDEIREIRNDVMHFDPDPITEIDLKKLRGFAAFLDRVRSLKAPSPKPN
jgi:CBS domain-containing protein